MNMIDIRRRQIADALNPMLLTDARYQTSDATQALAVFGVATDPC
ncbi:hypothetical protein [Xylella fastidiosa]|nr:hypothetical protein [Xylella fastidiosa]